MSYPPQVPNRPPFADFKRHTNLSDGLSPDSGRYHFFAAISLSIALSSMASASSLFSLLFSSSSVLRRLVSMPLQISPNVPK